MEVPFCRVHLCVRDGIQNIGSLGTSDHHDTGERRSACRMCPETDTSDPCWKLLAPTHSAHLTAALCSDAQALMSSWLCKGPMCQEPSSVLKGILLFSPTMYSVLITRTDICAQGGSCIVSYDRSRNPARQQLLLFPFYRKSD